MTWRDSSKNGLVGVTHGVLITTRGEHQPHAYLLYQRQNDSVVNSGIVGMAAGNEAAAETFNVNVAARW